MIPLLIPAVTLIGAALGTSSGRKVLGLSELWDEPSYKEAQNQPLTLKEMESEESSWRLKKLGQRLAFLRETKKFSATELAEKSGISRPALKNLEDGGDMKLSTLFAVSSALGIPVLALLDGLQPELQEDVSEALKASQSKFERELREKIDKEIRAELALKNNSKPSEDEGTWIEMETEDGHRVRLKAVKK